MLRKCLTSLNVRIWRTITTQVLIVISFFLFPSLNFRKLVDKLIFWSGRTIFLLQTKLETTANLSAKTQLSRLYHTVDIDVSKWSRVGCALAHPMAKFGRIGILEEDNVKTFSDGLCETRADPKKSKAKKAAGASARKILQAGTRAKPHNWDDNDDSESGFEYELLQNTRYTGLVAMGDELEAGPSHRDRSSTPLAKRIQKAERSHSADAERNHPRENIRGVNGRRRLVSKKREVCLM